MNNSKTGDSKLYENLGKLFYSVSACDGHIHELETLQLKQLVKYKWMSLEEFDGADAATHIETTFDWLVSQSANFEDCFVAFENYKKDHSEIFSKEICKLTLNTAYAIADAFEGINNEEMAMLKRLVKILKN